MHATVFLTPIVGRASSKSSIRSVANSQHGGSSSKLDAGWTQHLRGDWLQVFIKLIMADIIRTVFVLAKFDGEVASLVVFGIN